MSSYTGHDRRKKVLVSLAVLGVTAALVAVGTYATFTSTASVSQGPCLDRTRRPRGCTGLNTTYFYVLRAKDLNWRSSNSNQASATTPLLCL